MTVCRVFSFLLTLIWLSYVPGALAQDQPTSPDSTQEFEVRSGEASSDDGSSHAYSQDGGHEEKHGEGHGHAKVIPPLWLVAPFVILLLLIATGPLFYSHHWHSHYPKYAVGLGLFVTLYYLFVLQDGISMLHALQEYLSFIALVASLFIAASGIFLKVNARGTPLANVSLLSIGAVVANLIATTGAAMLFIRPYMRLNKGRLKAYHIVFFHFHRGQCRRCHDPHWRSSTVFGLFTGGTILLDCCEFMVYMGSNPDCPSHHILCD